MAEVYRFVLPDGQMFAWHNGLDALRKAHPEARIIGRLVTDSLGQGTWEPSSGKEAVVAERKAAQPAAREVSVKPEKKDAS